MAHASTLKEYISQVDYYFKTTKLRYRILISGYGRAMVHWGCPICGDDVEWYLDSIYGELPTDFVCKCCQGRLNHRFEKPGRTNLWRFE